MFGRIDCGQAPTVPRSAVKGQSATDLTRVAKAGTGDALALAFTWRPADRQGFERLRAELSATFINLPAEQVESHVAGALGRIAGFLELERATLYELSETHTELTATVAGRRSQPFANLQSRRSVALVAAPRAIRRH